MTSERKTIANGLKVTCCYSSDGKDIRSILRQSFLLFVKRELSEAPTLEDRTAQNAAS